MKKILILTVTAGNGHNACARSIKDKLESLGGAEVKIVDLLKEYSTKLNVWVADGGYCLSVARLLPLYNAFYEKYRKLPPEKRYSCPSQGTVLTTLAGLLQEIYTFKPDVIYATHFYGAIAVTDLKLCYKIPAVCVATTLDYVNSPFWEAGIGVGYLTLANEEFIPEFMREGFKREQLLPLGLPVDERTLQVADKEKSREKLGLNGDIFTVMVMFGGGYWSGGLRIFKQLCKALKGRRAQIIMICGKDEKTFKKIEKMQFDQSLKVLNVGFTQDIPDYMACADVVVNKCGGLSSTEILNVGAPMLVTERLAAQEKHNLEYIRGKNAALSFKNGKELKDNILRLYDDSGLLKKMSEATKPLRKPAVADLANFILSQPDADYSDILSGEIQFKDVKRTVKKALKKADKLARKNK